MAFACAFDMALWCRSHGREILAHLKTCAVWSTCRGERSISAPCALGGIQPCSSSAVYVAGESLRAVQRDRSIASNKARIKTLF